MTDLVEFIEARLAEDEAHAKKDLHMLDRSSSGGAWEYGVGYNLPYSELGPGGSIGRLTATYGRPLADGEPDQHNADVMLVARMVRSARRRAERALREVEAKRRLLADHAIPADRWPDDPYHQQRRDVDQSCAGCGANYREEPMVEDINDCPMLRAVAAVWSDHPDYRTEWSPT